MIAARNIAAILLAAGRSERFGNDDKLMAPLDGEPLALHAARTIAALAPGRRIAVCERADGPLAGRLAPLGYEIAANPHPEQGLSRSLARGIAAAETAEAALVCLADMPFVTTAHLGALLARFDAETAPVVASARDGTPMPPALFARSLFGALQAGEGDQGGRALLARAALVPATAGELADIDRPGDLSDR